MMPPKGSILRQHMVLLVRLRRVGRATATATLPLVLWLDHHTPPRLARALDRLDAITPRWVKIGTEEWWTVMIVVYLVVAALALGRVVLS